MEIGTPVLDFIGISATFVLMLVFFGVKNKKHAWAHYLVLISFVGQCLIIIIFHEGLYIKAYAVLMLISVILIEGFTRSRRKLAS